MGAASLGITPGPGMIGRNPILLIGHPSAISDSRQLVDKSLEVCVPVAKGTEDPSGDRLLKAQLPAQHISQHLAAHVFHVDMGNTAGMTVQE